MNYSPETILFAEDLMKYVFQIYGSNYVPKSKRESEKHKEPMSTSPFRLVIGKSVCNGIGSNVHELYQMFEHEFSSTLDAPSFARNVMELLPDWFPEGYHPICFIEFCIMVCATALSFHKAGFHEISSCACEIIAIVLTRQMMKGEFKQKGGWERLVRVSTELIIVDRQMGI